MQKYVCNNCGKAFDQDASVNPSCPVCGSNRLTKDINSSGKSFYQENIFLISIAVLVLLILVLFLLPSSSKYYDIIIEKFPKKCLFTVVVIQGKKTADPEKFEYSSDNGKTWQLQADFQKSLSGTFWIKVRHLNGDTAFLRQYKKPLIFNPTCDSIIKNDCECSQLQVVMVNQTIMNGKPAILVKTSLPMCSNKEYIFVIQGKTPIVQKDSVFYPTEDCDVDISAKTEKCASVSFAMNPFKFKFKVKLASKSEIQDWINKFIQKPRDNRLMANIISNFDENNIVNIIGRKKNNENQTIQFYLTDYKFNHDTIKKIFVVVDQIIPDPKTKRVKEITIREIPIKK